MGDVVNLRQFRKARERSQKEEAAAANRAKFGRAKDEKELSRARSERENTLHQGHLRDGFDDDPQPA